MNSASLPATGTSSRAADADNPDQIDEAAVRELDRAAQSASLPSELLNTSPMHDMRVRIQQVIALLEELDFAGLLSSRGWLSRLTGADIEARLKFELAGERVLSAMEELRVAAHNATHIHSALVEAQGNLRAEQGRLEGIIADARKRLDEAQNPEEFHRARFERRLANIMAIHASNMLTIRQMDLAMVNLSGLLDRFTDVDTLLLPLWQRNMLALASSTKSTQKNAATVFSSAHSSLVQCLKQGEAAP